MVALNIWLLSVAGHLARYALFAGAFALLSDRWARQAPYRRIQPRRGWPGQTRLEIRQSVQTIAIFGVAGYLLYLGAGAGVFRIYGADEGYGTLYWIANALAIIIAHDAYFYWTHRLMHHPRLYRWVHRGHHRSRTPQAWAALSFAPAEAVVQAAFPLLYTLVIPSDYAVLVVFLTVMTFKSALGHSGIEWMPRFWLTNRLTDQMTACTHHDLHHEAGRGNFGLYFTWWDRWMKTEAPDYAPRFAATTTPAGATAPGQPASDSGSRALRAQEPASRA